MVQGAQQDALKVISWKTELIPSAGRLRFLQKADSAFDFDFLLLQEWARECDAGTDPAVGEFRIATFRHGT